MILFGSSFSPYVRKVLVVAAEKGVDLEVRSVGIGDQDEQFREASPLGKMPALVDGDYRWRTPARSFTIWRRNSRSRP